MKRLRNHLIGVDQGEVMLFSDFEAGGAMWAGEGARERRRPVAFSERFRSAPVVQVSVSMWDLDHTANLRGELRGESVTAEAFEIVFRTWGDSRIARLRVAWTAIGELPQDDDWEL
jgi:hypothetical protein